MDKPRTKSAAEEMGVAAVEAWISEASTPPLDVAPALSDEDLVALRDLLGTVPAEEEAEFPTGAWGAIAPKGDRFISLADSVFTAAHAYVAMWRHTRTAPP